MANQKKSLWCVCGQTADGPWEPCETGLARYDDAAAWLRENAERMFGEHQYTAFYLDREENDGRAHEYYDFFPCGGELVLTNC